MTNGLKKITALLLSALILSGCSLQATPTKTNRFNLSVNTWVGFGPLWLAQDQGYFKEEGLDTNISIIEDAAQRKAALTKGSVDGLGDTVDLIVAERDQGVPAVGVMQFDFSNGADGILATKDIQRIEDLRGKKIAVQRNFVSEAFLDYVLKQHGMTPKDVTLIDTEASAAGAAFVAGSVDVAVTFEPWMSKAKDRAGGHILVSSRDVPGVLVDVLSVNENYLKHNPDSTKKLMLGWYKAVDFWRAHPEEADAIMAKHYNVTPAEFADLITGVTWPNLTDNQTYVSRNTQPGTMGAVAQTFSDIFMELGTIKHPVDLTKAIDPTLISTLNDTH